MSSHVAPLCFFTSGSLPLRCRCLFGDFKKKIYPPRRVFLYKIKQKSSKIIKKPRKTNKNQSKIIENHLKSTKINENQKKSSKIPLARFHMRFY